MRALLPLSPLLHKSDIRSFITAVTHSVGRLQLHGHQYNLLKKFLSICIQHRTLTLFFIHIQGCVRANQGVRTCC